MALFCFHNIKQVLKTKAVDEVQMMWFLFLTVEGTCVLSLTHFIYIPLIIFDVYNIFKTILI